MQWLELIVSLAASGDLVFACLNCLYFLGYVQATPSPSRRVGAVALIVIQGGLALEALLFLSQAPVAAQSWTRATAVMVVRGSLFLSSALVSVLIWRSLGPRRR